MKQLPSYAVARAFVLFLYRLVEPISDSEDIRRREFLANVILLWCIVFLFVGAVTALVFFLKDEGWYDGLHPGVFFIGTIFSWILYMLSRNGFSRFSSYVLVIGMFIGITYGIVVWGADLPQALLSYALIITIAGVLITTRIAVIVTVLIGGVIGIVSYLQINGNISLDISWKEEMFDMGDVVVTIVSFSIIAVLSWLSNREIYRSLDRARKSEKLLAEERDMLEVKVAERTRALEEAQLEKTLQLYRFAELGRISSGLFHDLVNPLTSVSLNLELMKDNVHGNKNENLENAIANINSMRKYTEASRRQIQNQEILSFFSPSNEIELVIKMLSFKAREADVVVEYKMFSKNTELYGNSVKFYRLVTGLVANAIESYEAFCTLTRKVIITLSETEKGVHMTVEDFGCGISPEYMEKIFQPLFTTKSNDKGTGIGLMICKDIVEKDFGGTISVTSEKTIGTTFFVTLPKNQPKESFIHSYQNEFSETEALSTETSSK